MRKSRGIGEPFSKAAQKAGGVSMTESSQRVAALKRWAATRLVQIRASSISCRSRGLGDISQPVGVLG